MAEASTSSAAVALTTAIDAVTTKKSRKLLTITPQWANQKQKQKTEKQWEGVYYTEGVGKLVSKCWGCQLKNSGQCRWETNQYTPFYMP